jgi:hypothetical protein
MFIKNINALVHTQSFFVEKTCIHILCKFFFGLLLGMCMCKLQKLGQGTYLMFILRNAKGAWEDL